MGPVANAMLAGALLGANCLAFVMLLVCVIRSDDKPVFGTVLLMSLSLSSMLFCTAYLAAKFVQAVPQ